MHAIGLSAGRIAEFDPEYVRIHLRRLFWLLSDKLGRIGWRAPEAIGEILACCPGKFDEFFIPLFHLMDMEAEDGLAFEQGCCGRLGASPRQSPKQCSRYSISYRLSGRCQPADPRLGALVSK